MPGSNGSKWKRIAAGILGILLLVIMLFSAFCIAEEADHDCTGENCPICAWIQQCENTLHQIGDGMDFQAAISIPLVFFLVSSYLSAFGFIAETLVSKKIRLNN